MIISFAVPDTVNVSVPNTTPSSVPLSAAISKVVDIPVKPVPSPINEPLITVPSILPIEAEVNETVVPSSVILESTNLLAPLSHLTTLLLLNCAAPEIAILTAPEPS